MEAGHQIRDGRFETLPKRRDRYRRDLRLRSRRRRHQRPGSRPDFQKAGGQRQDLPRARQPSDFWRRSQAQRISGRWTPPDRASGFSIFSSSVSAQLHRTILRIDWAEERRVWNIRSGQAPRRKCGSAARRISVPRRPVSYFGAKFGQPKGLWLTDPWGKKLEDAPVPPKAREELLKFDSHEQCAALNRRSIRATPSRAGSIPSRSKIT